MRQPWLLAPGSWLLAPGSWLLAPGSWLLASPDFGPYTHSINGVFCIIPGA
ncbi:MAG: hypothetical protein ACT6QS_04295 [Flavobacteriales bacterium]